MPRALSTAVHSYQPLSSADARVSVQELGRLERASVALRPSERVKPDLLAEADDLIAAMERHRREGVWPPVSIVRLFNSGPLVMYHFGALEKAEALCQRALTLFGSLFETSGSFNWVQAGFQPYVNVARVAGARGAMRRMRDIHATLVQLLAAPANSRVPWFDEAVPGELLGTWLSSVRTRIVDAVLIDGFKALLLAGAYEDALALLERAGRDPLFGSPHHRDVAREGTVRALRGLQRDEPALTVLEELLAELATRGERSPGLEVLASDLLRRSGRRHDAHDRLRDVECYLNDRRSVAGAEAGFRQACYLAGLAWIALDEPARARTAALRALQLASACGDEVGMLKALTLLCDVMGRQGGWEKQLDTAAARTGYRVERGVALFHLGRTGAPERRLDRLIESRQTFAGVDVASAAWWATRVDREIRRSCASPCRAMPGEPRVRQAELSTRIGYLYDRLMSITPEELIQGVEPAAE
jgi:hypothetical protein